MAVQLNVSADELRKMDLGAHLATHVIYDDGSTRVEEHEFELGSVQKTTWYRPEPFMSAVKEQANDNQGKTFKQLETSEELGTKIGTYPMWMWAREIAPRQKDGNEKSLKKWLNEGDGKAFRTFEKTI
jgi:hypothetical protein